MSDEKPINKWLITITVMLPAIMEIIDTSVANVALPHMQGSLNAGTDEVTWVLTSYLVANAVVLPMTGWLSRVFGRKRFLMTCIVLFTLASLLWRIAQSGGAGILPGPPGGGRRRPDPDQPGYPDGDLSAPSARHGHGNLRDRRHVRPYRRPGPWRLDH